MFAMNSSNAASKTLTDMHKACPACEGVHGFCYAGEQIFPVHVAYAAGFETNRFSLWTCKQCKTTLTLPLPPLMGDEPFI